MGPEKLAHNRALDGARGLAVAIVVAYHAGVLRGGWIGVELFFVLSGFLITTLLMIEFGNSGSIDLRGFWLRRARRLLPALFALLALTAVYAVTIADRFELHRIRRDILAALTYSSNWVAIYGGGGYWQHFQAPSPLRHLWSLAVEEQFYLFFPLVAFACIRSKRPAVSFGAFAAAALAWQLWMTRHAPLDRVYLGTDTRAFGLFFGAWLGAMRSSTWVRQIGRIAPLALVGLLVSSVLLDGSAIGTFRGPFQLVTLMSVVLIAGLTAGDGGSLARLLELPALTTLGVWSYGVYLYHWPIALALKAKFGLTKWPLLLALIPLTLIVSYLSFRWIETPVRRGRLHGRRGWYMYVTAATLIVAIALGATTIGARQPLDAKTVAAGEVPDGGSDAAVYNRFGVNAQTGLIERDGSRPVRVMVVGDSVGASLAEALTGIADAADMTLFSRAAPSCSYDRVRTVGGIEFTEEQSCVDIVNGWRDDVAAFQPDVVIFSYGSWSGWTYDGEYRTQCDPVLARYVTSLYEAALDDLSSTGASVVFLAPAYWRANGVDLQQDSAYDCLRTVMGDFVAANPAATRLINVHPWLCKGHDCEASSEGVLVRPDGLHYSGPGAATVAVDVLRGIVNPPPAGWPATSPIEIH